MRALLLYPMNALANDQLQRLRRLLADAPQITFGRYTGDTPERAAEGASLYDSLNPGEPRLPNELLSRQEMRDNPPHLLLTNYAMLEYLLLRPADMDLFEGKHGGHWRFVVLDEAHVYDGAKAEEVGMLLRRLPRVRRAARTTRPSRRSPRAPRSATIRRRDRVRREAVRRRPSSGATTTRRARTWSERHRVDIRPDRCGPLGPAGYLALAAAADPAAELHGRAAHDPVAAGLGAGAAGSGDAALLLAHEQAMAKLRILLAAAPRPFAELAAEVFTGRDAPRRGGARRAGLGRREDP